MIVCEARFVLAEAQEVDDAVDAVWTTLTEWTHSGLIAHADTPVFVEDGAVVALVRVFDPDVLPTDDVELRVRGGDDGSTEVCDCSEPRELVLFTWLVDESPALRCLVCRGVAPLPRLTAPARPTHDGETVRDWCALWGWAGTYRACQELWLDSGFAEEFARSALEEYDGPLLIEARELGRAIEAANDRPCYVYLARGEGFEADPVCPSCGDGWDDPRDASELFVHRCDACRLVSHPPFGEPTP